MAFSIGSSILCTECASCPSVCPDWSRKSRTKANRNIPLIPVTDNPIFMQKRSKVKVTHTQ